VTKFSVTHLGKDGHVLGDQPRHCIMHKKIMRRATAEVVATARCAALPSCPVSVCLSVSLSVCNTG